MKTPASDRPRFTCRVARGCVSIFGDTTTGTPRGPGSAHVAACEDCQQFFGACDDLAVALKRDAAREWREAPAGLDLQIIRAINQSAARPARRESRGAWLSLAAAAACAVVAALVYQQRVPPVAAPEAAPAVAMTATADPAMVAVARQIVAAVPTDLFAEMKPQAEAILRQDPLQGEVDAMKSDARTALRFLARNFLPTSDGQAGSE